MHSRAICPFWRQRKQRPSLRYCSRSSSISFLNGVRGWLVALTSIGTIPPFEFGRGAFVRGVWNGPGSRGLVLLRKSSPAAIVFRILCTSARAASFHSSIVVGSLSRFMTLRWTLSFRPRRYLSIVPWASGSQPAARLSRSNIAV